MEPDKDDKEPDDDDGINVGEEEERIVVVSPSILSPSLLVFRRSSRL
jgi:hypothetical protein